MIKEMDLGPKDMESGSINRPFSLNEDGLKTMASFVGNLIVEDGGVSFCVWLVECNITANVVILIAYHLNSYVMYLGKC